MKRNDKSKVDEDNFSILPIEEKKRKNPKKDCNFITLNDFSMFQNQKIPSPDPTNFVLWYEKEFPEKWGITLKKFEKNERFNSQYMWKCTWIYSDLENILFPSPGSSSMIEPITGTDVERLNNIKLKYIEKTNNKKK
jgi:hypothetical protein